MTTPESARSNVSHRPSHSPRPARPQKAAALMISAAPSVRASPPCVGSIPSCRPHQRVLPQHSAVRLTPHFPGFNIYLLWWGIQGPFMICFQPSTAISAVMCVQTGSASSGIEIPQKWRQRASPLASPDLAEYFHCDMCMLSLLPATLPNPGQSGRWRVLAVPGAGSAGQANSEGHHALRNCLSHFDPLPPLSGGEL